MAEPEKKLHSERAADEIRADELIKATQIEARNNEDRLRDIPVTNSNYWKFKGENHHPLPKGIKWGIAGLAVIFVVAFVASYYLIEKHVTTSISSRATAIAAGVKDLQNLDPRSASAKFSTLNANGNNPPDFLGMLASLFTGSGAAIQSFSDLSNQLGALSIEMASAENDIFGGSSASSTSTFVGDLDHIRTTLASINADSNQLSVAATALGGASPVSGASYLALKTQVQGVQHFLDAFVPWLSDPSTTHHILVLLENPSEMRLGGGFLGSYADVSLRGGTITDIAVHDIVDVDATFKDKIIPPVPLQAELTGWRPADANWFFDFPTSASKTLAMFGRSGLYANASTSFDGVIAVTPQVMSDLLAATGPITLPTTTPGGVAIKFTADNLVVQIQKIVQAAQAKSSSGNATYPKSVLSQLSQALFAKLASSTTEERAAILGNAFDWIQNKDAMVYFNDPAFEAFAKSYGAAGDAYELPQNFNGDYLAIANADINSDKSQLYISQSVNFDGAINSDGSMTDHLIIDRAHHADQSPYWWYQTTNQDYFEISVVKGTTLDNQSGGIAKSVPAPINYAKQGYSTDPLLFAIVSSTQKSFTFPKVTTRDEAGKEIFSLWDRTYAGSSTKLSFDYSHHLFAPPAPGVQYQFVFEKQSGAAGDYKFEIDAPLGYIFAENDLASYIYESTSTPGRLVINLTLKSL